MESLFELLSQYNQECRHSESIKESKYIQKSSESLSSGNKGSYSFIREILLTYDPIFQTIPKKERKIYLKQLITKICSDIDEKSTDAYDNFKFNPRVLKKSLIQSSLQAYEKNHLSALLYLNEYYQRHFVIVVGDLYFETCLKSFPKDTIVFSSGCYTFQEVSLDSLKRGHHDHNPLVHDVKPDVYLMPLLPIGKYKVDQLKELCVEKGIALKDGTKAKVKKTLYDELNRYLLIHG